MSQYRSLSCLIRCRYSLFARLVCWMCESHVWKHVHHWLINHLIRKKDQIISFDDDVELLKCNRLCDRKSTRSLRWVSECNSRDDSRLRVFLQRCIDSRLRFCRVRLCFVLRLIIFVRSWLQCSKWVDSIAKNFRFLSLWHVLIMIALLVVVRLQHRSKRLKFKRCNSLFWIEFIICKRLRWFSLLFTIITILISISRDIDNIFHALSLYVERLFFSLRARCRLRRLRRTFESDCRRLQVIRRAFMIESFRHRLWILSSSFEFRDDFENFVRDWSLRQCEEQ